MSPQRKESQILKPSFIFSYVGLLGCIIYILLRPSFDFHSAAPIYESSVNVSERASSIASRVDLPVDSLVSMTQRYSDSRLFENLTAEDASRAGTTPHVFNRVGMPLNGWDVLFAEKYQQAAGLMDAEATFQSIGHAMFRFDNEGRVSLARFHPDRSTAGYSGDDLLGFSHELVFDKFGYNPLSYRQTKPQMPLIESELMSGEPPSVILEETPERVVFSRVNQTVPGPDSLVIRFRPLDVSDSEHQFNVEILGFRAHNLEDRPAESASGFEISSSQISFLITAMLMLLLVFGMSIRQIFRGRIEWKRFTILVFLFTIIGWLWLVLFYYPTYYQLFSDGVVIFDLFQQLMIALFMALYSGLAYVAWESLAREQNNGQIPVMDAIWSGNIINRQVGASVLSGYAVAGLILGIFAVGAYALGVFVIQSDSVAFSHREAASLVPGLNVTMNGWMSSMMYVIAHVALIYCITALITGKNWIQFFVTILIAAFAFTGSGYFFVITGDFWTKYLLITLICFPLVLSYRYLGLTSAVIAWFVVLLFTKMLPFVNSSDPSVLFESFIISGALIVPFVVGLTGYLSKKSLKNTRRYVPKYEEKLKKQLRYEQELQIAKESQFALLPQKNPQFSGMDVHGFFLPSFEVGGDFYDIISVQDDESDNSVLALAIVDVSGKAMQAAFNAVFTSGLLLSRISSDQPEEILTRANPTLYYKTDSKTFVTCQTARVDAARGILTLANAGHCPPFLIRDGNVTEIKSAEPRFPLGIREHVNYKSTTHDIQKGDLLIFYSDGLPEAKNKRSVRFEEESLGKLLSSIDTNSSAKEISEHIKKEILEFSNYELADDTTLIIIKIG